MERLLSEPLIPLTSAFLASLLTFAFGQFAYVRSRNEDRRRNQIEVDLDSIRQLQEAAATYVDSILMAIVLFETLTQESLKSRLAVTREPWMINWITSRRALEIQGYRVRDNELRRLAFELKDEISDDRRFKTALSSAAEREMIQERADHLLDQVQCRAGTLIREIHIADPKA